MTKFTLEVRRTENETEGGDTLWQLVLMPPAVDIHLVADQGTVIAEVMLSANVAFQHALKRLIQRVLS